MVMAGRISIYVVTNTIKAPIVVTARSHDFFLYILFTRVRIIFCKSCCFFISITLSLTARQTVLGC